jgi:hypothetical protein
MGLDGDIVSNSTIVGHNVIMMPVLIAESNHHKPCCNNPWQRTVGVAVDHVQQGFPQMGAYPPSPCLLDEYQSE